MVTTELHLYRTKFIAPKQLPLLAPGLTPTDIFLIAIQSRPEVQLRRGVTWHIGNLELLEETHGRFAIGRTTKTTVERFDETTGDFVEMIDDAAPYTSIYFNATIGLIGIAKKGTVAPDTDSVARTLKILLEKTSAVIGTGVEVRIDPIPDPDNFIEKLRSAYAIKNFRASFTGPNPIDADEIFQRPMAIYCRESNAQNGHVEVSGDHLNVETLEAVTKSTAATGNNASALVKFHPRSKTTRVQLKKQALRIQIESDSSLTAGLEAINTAYHSVRNSDN